jgi:hypothetical protein
MVVAANRPAVAFYERHGLVEAACVDGVAYMHEQMAVEFAGGASPRPRAHFPIHEAVQGSRQRR